MSDVGQWISEWVRSPGFGGVAALVAAVIAYRAARRAAAVQRANANDDRDQRERAERKNQWWLRAQWALDRTLDQDSEARTVGFNVLQALAESEWADQHEADIVAAATDRALYPQGSPPEPPSRTLRRRRRRS